MAADFAFRTVRAIRWDGTNGDAVAALCDRRTADGDAVWTVELETTEALALRQQSGPATWAIWYVTALSPWVVVAADFGGILARLTDREYQRQVTTADEIWDVIGGKKVPQALLANDPWLTALAAKLRPLLGLPWT